MATLGLCALAGAVQASEVVREISWSAVKNAVPGLPGEVRPAGAASPFEYLELRNNEASARTFPLLDLAPPGIARPRYALTGQVRYEGVEGTGYLEMWSALRGQGRFFSRTLAGAGPMRSLSGSSPWRDFVLPFDASSAPAPVERLTVSVVLPGRGTVQLGGLRLVQYAEGEDLMATPGAWWGPRTAGLVGGITGSLLGCVGALIGILSSRGRGRALVLGLARGMIVFGAAALVLGVVALFRRQPYEVFYPLLLEGVLSVALPIYLIPMLRRRYDEVELRRMTAQDLSAGRA